MMLLPQTTRANGFTLIELTVAGIIAALLTAATSYTVIRAVEARDALRSRQQANSRAHTALLRIEREAVAMLRNPEPSGVLIRVDNAEHRDRDGRTWSDDELLLFARGLRPVRPDFDQAEGVEYESQFRIIREYNEPPALWHRRDPVIDEYYDGGGVVTPVADQIVGLDLQVFDGADWREDWDSDELGIPLGIRIAVTARSDDGRAVIERRGLVSFDRTPLPLSTEETLESFDMGSGMTGGDR